MRGSPASRHSLRRPGAVAVMVMIMLPVILGFAALVIDVGALHCAKADLQRAADAAALAGVSTYLSDSGLRQEQSEIVYLVTERTQQTSLQNPTLGDPTILEVADIAVGRHDFDNPTGPLGGGERWNAVQVTVRRTAESPNGPVPFFFARIWDRFYGDVTAHARAAMNDHFAGYRLVEPGRLIPFAVREDVYEDMVDNGPDNYSYDEAVSIGGDGVPEAKLFPWVDDDLEDDLPAGNFGTLNIGIGNQGTSFLGKQIEEGLSPSEMQDEFGTTELMFYDADGALITHNATGNPGLSSGMEPSVKTRVGDVVGFFVYQTASAQGANATYVVTGIRFGRVMAVNLKGPQDKRSIVIQPVAATDANVIVDEEAPSTDGQIGRVMLVQ